MFQSMPLVRLGQLGRSRLKSFSISSCVTPAPLAQINQWDTDADLNGGATLSDTIALSSHTVVVLDPGGLPLRRLWCLYEIGQTLRTALSADKLVLLAHGAEAAALAELVEEVCHLFLHSHQRMRVACQRDWHACLGNEGKHLPYSWRLLN